MDIRLLQRKDIQKAATIVGKNYSKKWQLSATRELAVMFDRSVGTPTYFVAEENGKIIGLAGYIQSWMDYSIYQIFWVNVLPERQKQGIGTKLVDRVVKEIRKKKDAEYILLTTTLPEYYRNHWGFKVLKTISKGYQLMILTL